MKLMEPLNAEKFQREIKGVKLASKMYYCSREGYQSKAAYLGGFLRKRPGASHPGISSLLKPVANRVYLFRINKRTTEADIWHCLYLLLFKSKLCDFLSINFV